MGSALLNPAAALEFSEAAPPVVPMLGSRQAEHASTVPGTAGELRAQVAERLAAHRSRRGGVQPLPDAVETARPAGARSARIAAAVAERYAQTPSYRAVLAAEAERATQQAKAAAEVAALNAQAIAAAQQRLLAAYDEHVRFDKQAEKEQSGEAVAMQLWPESAPAKGTETSVKRSAKTAQRNSAADRALACEPAEPPAPAVESPSSAGFTVRLYEDGARAMRAQDTFRGAPVMQRSAVAENSLAEAMALDEEIAFRHAPVFEEPAGPPVSLPANLIEFPRQLVAARKARPRYAEGPLRDEMDAAPGDGQLRIFEVDPAQISISPEETGADMAQWTSIWLDAPAELPHATGALTGEGAGIALQPASLARRGMAASINCAIVVAGMVAFAGAVGVTIAHGNGFSLHTGLPMSASVRQIAAQIDLSAKSAGIVAAVSCVVLLLIYHALFFVFSAATPGMRCVRIAFCTFDEESPTRQAVRQRMLATMLSALPLGMGYAWAALDEERLTWHDRMSRMYLRRY